MIFYGATIGVRSMRRDSIDPANLVPGSNTSSHPTGFYSQQIGHMLIHSRVEKRNKTDSVETVISCSTNYC